MISLETGCNKFHYNNGDPRSIVPYEEILFDNGIVCKKCPHPMAASQSETCGLGPVTHDKWSIGFNFVIFSYIDNDPDNRVDFMETINMAYLIKPKDNHQQYLYEACSDLEIGDKQYPRFHDKDEVFKHCVELIKKEFDVKPADKISRCIKLL